MGGRLTLMTPWGMESVCAHRKKVWNKIIPTVNNFLVPAVNKVIFQTSIISSSSSPIFLYRRFLLLIFWWTVERIIKRGISRSRIFLFYRYWERRDDDINFAVIIFSGKLW